MVKPLDETLVLNLPSLHPVLPFSLLPSTSTPSGEWVNGVISGIGTLFIANGDKYTGEWKDGMMHGKKIEGGKGRKERGVKSRKHVRLTLKIPI